MSKIYRKYMFGSQDLADADLDILDVIDTWVAEENLRIIGYSVGGRIGVLAAGFPTADMAAYMDTELTFSSLERKDAVLGKMWMHIARLLFGSPAAEAAWTDVAKNETVMFPSGSFVDMKEGETLSMLQKSGNVLGATVSFYSFAIIYYQK